MDADVLPRVNPQTVGHPQRRALHSANRPVARVPRLEQAALLADDPGRHEHVEDEGAAAEAAQDARQEHIHQAAVQRQHDVVVPDAPILADQRGIRLEDAPSEGRAERTAAHCRDLVVGVAPEGRAALDDVNPAQPQPIQEGAIAAVSRVVSAEGKDAHGARHGYG